MVFCLCDYVELILEFRFVRLIGMVGEAWLSSNAYFSWLPDYTIYFGSMSACLNITNFAFVYVDFMIFPEYSVGMLTFLLTM